MERLDSIFRTGFRPAEKIDTWQGIRREEQTGSRQRKEHGQKEKPAESFADDTVLSTLSLHGFLITLLRQAGEGGQTMAEEEPSPVIATPSPPASPAAQRAASAYQTTAHATSPGSSVSLGDSPPPVAAAPAIVLSPDELRRIHILLKDVETLAAHGVATITLRPAENFLQSLADAVADALLN